MFEFTDPPNYEPSHDMSIAARAEKRGIPPEELAYDLLLAGDGKAMLYVVVANYADGNVDFVKELVPEARVVFGLGDGGAHYGFLCDAGYPTYMLSYLTRDRKAGCLPLPEVVKALTKIPAEVVGLSDRGIIAPGYKADINVIDYAALQVRVPEVRNDLPAGGIRFHQSATGYRYTFCGGELIRKDDAPTGKLPGKLVRAGARWA
jgi:N-acyl-D-aspartate/D-glutamate deacylase